MGLVAKAFQDIITFSRASSGTYVNSNGYITNSSVLNYLTYSNQPENAAWTKSNSFVQQNLLLRSEEFNDATWVKGSAGAGVLPVVTANQGVAPDGTLTADRVDFNCGALTIADRSYLTQQVTVTAGVAYTDSIWIKAFDTATVGKTIRFVLESGGASGTNVFTITDQWQRIVVSGAGAVGAFVNVLIETRGTYSSSATASLLVWGAQLVQGSVPGDYRATTSAALPCLYADYNGALRARKLSENAANSEHFLIEASSTVVAGSVNTGAIYVKSGERTVCQLRLYSNGSPVASAYFDIATNAFSGISGGTWSSVSVGGGWYRISAYVVFGTATSNGIGVFLAPNAVGGTSYTGNGSSGIYIADAQLNDGSSALAYYDTTASAYNAPRFDYDPVTLAAKGLLVEESRANLLLRSNDWSATWSLTNITRTAAAALGPDGQMSMTKLEATAGVATSVIQSFTATSTAHTYSVFVKQGNSATEANLFYFRNVTTSTNLVGLSINYSTGVITQTIGTGAVSRNFGNGIWRIEMPATTGITIGDSMQVYTGFIGNAETAGEYLYAFGAQVEAGALATSYIPTVASQVTRAADVASVNTLSPWFNQAAGTFYAEFDVAGVAPAGSGNILGDGAAGTSIAYLNPTFNLVSYNGTSGPTTSNATSANTIAKASLAYATNSRRAVLNAGTASNQTGDLQAVTKLELGKAFGNTFLNGHLRRVTFYPRQFTAAEQQTLTTL